MKRTLADIARHLGGRVVGDPGLAIRGVASLENAEPGQLTYFGSPRLRALLEKTRASAVLVREELELKNAVNQVVVQSPYVAYARVAQLFFPVQHPAFEPSARGQIHSAAHVDASAQVFLGATVCEGASVGPRSVVYPGAYVGAEAQVGADCVLYPNAVIMERCAVGDRVVMHPGAVVGSDGFGYAYDEDAGEHVKIPQLGRVRIEDDVELGANTCVDRAAHGETVIGRGTKVDNLVQIAHNVRLGPNGIVCAQVGIAGSAILGANVLLAGQVGVAGHLTIGKNVKVGPQAGVAHDWEDGATISGTPAMEHARHLRVAAALDQLPDLVREVRSLRKRVSLLEETEQEEG